MENFINKFEEMRERAELNALSKVSLIRLLTDSEFVKFKSLSKKYLGEKIE
jgi:hypothetical protein